MSDRIVVNPGDLLDTAKVMGTVRGELQLLARRIVSDPMPEMPASITAQVRTGAGRASAALFRHSNELEPVVTDLRRRARWAELASASTGRTTLTKLRPLVRSLDLIAPKKKRKRRYLPDPKPVTGDPKTKRRFKINLKASHFTPDEVNQGAVGDCYFAAAVASLANTQSGRALLRKLIKDNGDGTYTVTFLEGTKIRVDTDLYVRNGVITYGDGSATSNKANWFSILEKAFAQYCNNSYNVLDQGGFASEAWLGLGLINARTTEVGVSTSPDTVWRLIDGQMHHKGKPHPVVVDISGTNFEGLPGVGHALSALDCYERNGERWVVLRNPWGYNNGSAEGAQMPMNEALLLHGAKLSVPDNGVFSIRIEELTKITSDVEHG